MAIDSRVNIWTNPTTHATGTTTNTGSGIDAFQGNAPAGGTYEGSRPTGFGVVIQQTNVTGTAQVTVWEYDISTDNSTFREGGTLGIATLDSAGVVRIVAGTIHLPRSYRYFRLVANNTGTGTSTSVAYLDDQAGHEIGGRP